MGEGETVCPSCGSPGKFKPRRRLENDHLFIFVMCPACPYEEIIRSGPKEVVELEMDVDRLRGRVEAGEQTLVAVLRAREQALARLRAA